MDDVVLIHNTKEGLQQLLDITDKTAKKYHIEFGKEKSKIMVMGTKQKPIDSLKLGDLILEQTNKYKYLGEMINDKGYMEDQIKEIRGKAEAAFQTILTIAGDHKLRGIQMKTIWKLVETCIKPIITYAAETWNPTKTEMKKLNAILDNIIKTNTPDSHNNTKRKLIHRNRNPGHRTYNGTHQAAYENQT